MCRHLDEKSTEREFFLQKRILRLAVLFFLLFLSSNVTAQTTIEDVKAVARLYSAAFDRDPKVDGLNFWVDSYEGGRSLIDIAKDFYNSPEFTEKYGTLNDRKYVEQLFRNVLGRDGAEQGIEFWSEHLSSGTSRAKVLAEFSGSPENVDKTTETFANMCMVDGMWQFESLEYTCNGIISGSIEEGVLLLVDKRGEINDLVSTFGREPDVDRSGNGLNDSYSFTFTNLLTRSSIRLYLIVSGKIYSVYGDNDGDGIPNSNVFALADDADINLGSISERLEVEKKLLTEFDLFGQPGVLPRVANPRIPIGIERPPLSGLSTPELVQAGMAALFSGWIGGANTYLERAIATTGPGSSQEADAARFFMAFSQLATIVSESASDGNPSNLDRLSDALDLLGVPNDVTRGYFVWMDVPEEIDQSKLSAERLAEFIDEKSRDDVAFAVKLLEQVSSKFRSTWIRPDNDKQIENDYGDVLFFLGLLKLEQAFIAINDAYDLDFDINSLVERSTDDNPANDAQVESFLEENPSFLSLASRAQLARARDLFLLGAVTNLEQALRRIEAETDSQEDDLIRITSWDNDELSRTRSYLENIRRSVEVGETLIEADADGDQNKDLVLDLRRFFADGIDFRGDGLLPPVIGNDLDKSRPCLPDPTFNGVVISPNLDSTIYNEFECN